jgi:hypothetical protein
MISEDLAHLRTTKLYDRTGDTGRAGMAVLLTTILIHR